MSISYRLRRSVRRFFTGLLVLVLFASLALVCWLLWLNRYVVYSQDGARLDFGLSVEYAPGQTPVEPEPAQTVPVHNMSPEENPEPEDPVSNALTQFSGYYVTLEQLTEDFESVKQQLEALPQGSVIALELKDVKSRVYYTSEAAEEKGDFDAALTDALVASLRSKGHYVMAIIPSFQEYFYILADEAERVPYGLPLASSDGPLWLDSDGPCYWLNPASDGTMTHLIQLITELRSLGFDEVVLQDFRFPRTSKIRFTGDKDEALTKAAATLVKTCATDSFCVSFVRSQADLPLPEGRTRLYLSGVDAADADTQAAASGLGDIAAQVVFITQLSDTRYEDFSVLRPLDSAH